MMLKLITFDITGTLLMLTESVGYHYSRVGLRYGVNAPPDALTNHFYKEFKKLICTHPNFGETTGLGWEAWWKKLVLGVFQGAMPDVKFPSSSIDNISSDLIEVFKTKECWKLTDGAQNLLETLKNNNLSLGVISNYDPRLHDILNDLCITKYFDFVVISYEAKYLKPEPGIFNIAEEMKTGVAKNEILHIGDNPELDYYGATNAGWHALLVTEEFDKRNRKFDGVDENFVVQNIQEIINKLNDLKLL